MLTKIGRFTLNNSHLVLLMLGWVLGNTYQYLYIEFLRGTSLYWWVLGVLFVVFFLLGGLVEIIEEAQEHRRHMQARDMHSFYYDG